MRETELTTLVYKYNPYARFVFFLYLLVIFLFFLIAIDLIPMYIIWLVFCVWAIPLVYGAVSKKTVFNFRAWDKNMLTISPSCIWVGRQRFDVKEVKIDLQIHAYDGLVYRIRREGLLTPQTTYGNGNVLTVQNKGGIYDVEFHLRNYDSYSTLCTIVNEWKQAGVNLVVKESFTQEFVKKQYERKMRRRK